MEKKFIKRDDLGEIMESLADYGLKHPQIRIIMDIETWLGDQLLRVRVTNANYKNLAEQNYSIISGIEDDYDVLDQTVEKALADIEKAEAEKENSSTTTEDNNTKTE